MRIIKSTCILYFLLINLSFMVAGQSKNLSDDRLYDDLRTIQGRITILNHPTLGKTEGRNLQILFQRVDCKKCFVSVKSDSEGNYSLTISKGKYRIVSQGPKVTNGEYYDLLSLTQKRIIDVSSKRDVVNFDVEIVLPPD